MNGWSWYWAGWLLLVVTTFLVPECYALATGHGENTLSAQVWKIEDFKAGQHVWAWSAGHWLIGGMLVVFLLWLMGHFVLGWWR